MDIGKDKKGGEIRPDVVVVPPQRMPEQTPQQTPTAVPDRERVPA